MIDTLSEAKCDRYTKRIQSVIDALCEAKHDGYTQSVIDALREQSVIDTLKVNTKCDRCTM